MKILVDADSCPRPARELVVRAARRWKLPAIFAANRPIPVPGGDEIQMELCPPGENAADDRLVECAEAGDLAITRDIALAARFLEKQVRVIDDRGGVCTRENIRERLSLRDFMVGLAEAGLGVKRTARYGRKERIDFANALDRELGRSCSLRFLP